MPDSLESLRRKMENASELGSVVRTMKAMAASNINQFEMAVLSLNDYYRTVAMGIFAYFNKEKVLYPPKLKFGEKEKKIGAIVFGSDMGLVGQFNDQLADFVIKSLQAMDGQKEIWVIGERIQSRLKEAGYPITRKFLVPGSVNAITPLVGQILMACEQSHARGELSAFYLFYNSPNKGNGFGQAFQPFLPLDQKWMEGSAILQWPTKKPPVVAGYPTPTLAALISEYLFVSLYRACAESLASENAARLAAMQRAEKNIEELGNELSFLFNRLRQNSIDEELFDVIAGAEALQKETLNT